MTQAELLRFGHCELHIASRELRLADQLQDVEPRVFDLLLYLIRHRDRVVRPDELLEHVWCGAVVSENVVTRTVMKARKAIGDKPGGRSVIRTLHRVGYRFMADGATAPMSVPAPQPMTSPAAAPVLQPAGPLLRLGLLPFDNFTGDADLGWIEMGLTALVAQALQADARISVLPPAAIHGALVAAGSLPEARGRTVERLLGLQCVIHTTVHSQRGGYRIDYRSVGIRSAGVHGSLAGTELTALGQQLAARMQAQLFQDRQPAVAFQSTDPVANQAHARAMQAFSEERWQSASKLLQVVLDIEPHSSVAAAAFVWVLAALHDSAAFIRGEPLLQQALASGDTRLAATVHHALGHAHLNIHGPKNAARHHMDEALRLAAGHGAADWVLAIYTAQARHEQLKRNFVRARLLYRQAAIGNEAAGNRIELAKIINNCAVMDALTGNLLGARSGMEESLRISQELLLDSNIAASGGNLAEANAELGFLRLATAQCDGIAGCIATLQDGRRAAGVSLALCGVYAEWPDLPRIERVLAALRGRADSLQAGMQPFVAMVAGVAAAARGDFTAACAGMQNGIALAADLGIHLMVEQWLPLLLRTALAGRRFGVVDATCAQIRALRAFHDDEKLQGLLLHARAVQLHAQGDAAGACALLTDAVQWLPLGRWSAYARLDAAWLHLEGSRGVSARRLLRDIQPWLDEHPAGLLTQARFHAARAEWAEAAALQQRAIDALPTTPPRDLRVLLQIYKAGAAGRPRAMAAALSLPSMRVALASVASGSRCPPATARPSAGR